MDKHPTCHMVDPPAATTEAAPAARMLSSRASVDPIATSPLAATVNSLGSNPTPRRETATIHTPTGSVEVVSSKSFGSSSSSSSGIVLNNESESSQEHQQEQENTRSTSELFYTPASHLKGGGDSNPSKSSTTPDWVPPADLSALKLAAMPKLRQFSKKSPDSVPLMTSNSAASHENTNAVRSPHASTTTSPTLNLPLPPESKSASSSGVASPKSPSRRNSSSNNTTTTNNNNSNSKGSSSASSLTRKAQRYSSLKKRTKNGGTGGGTGSTGNSLLNRLFCNANMSSPMAAFHDEELVHFTSDEPPPPAAAEGTSANAKHTTTPNKSKSGSSSPYNCRKSASSACNLSKSIMEQARENLTLHDTDKISNSIQTSLQDLVACTTATTCATSVDSSLGAKSAASSAKTTTTPTTKHEQKLVGDASVGSSSKAAAAADAVSSASTRKAAIPVDEAPVGIEQPTMALNTNLDYDDICGTASDTPSSSSKRPSSTPNKERVPASAAAPKPAKSSDDAMTPNKKSSKPMKTPGGLVIPTPFTSKSSKGIFPSTLNAKTYAAASRSNSKSPNRNSSSKKSPKLATSEKDRPPRKSSSEATAASAANLPRKNSSGSFSEDGDTASSSTALTEPMSLSHSNTSPEKAASNNRTVEQQPVDVAASAFELLRITSSLEDLSTVPEVTSSKETTGGGTTEDDTAFLPNLLEEAQAESDTGTSSGSFGPTAGTKRNNDNDHCNDMVLEQADSATSSDSFVPRVLDAATASLASTTSGDSTLAAAQSELREELQREQQLLAAMASTSEDSNESPSEHSLRTSEEQAAEIKALKTKYERKINEQKDQFKLAHRLARMRLQEIERLEAQMDDMKDRQADESSAVVAKLQSRLDQMQQERNKFEQRVRQEMEAKLRQATSGDSNGNSTTTELELDRVRAELEAVKSQLALPDAGKSSMTDSFDVGEFERVQNELADIRSQLDAKDAKLAAKEIELAQAKSGASGDDQSLKVKTEGELSRPSTPLSEVKRVMAELSSSASKESTQAPKDKQLLKSPTRFSYPGTPTRSSTPVRKAGKERDEALALYEREKESLCKQIALLDQQAAASSQEHERALGELRRASELEIARIKKDMQNRIEDHNDRERELKESLSEVSSREKEELLEQIAILQAEKNTQHSGSLREVEKKEDLLRRISMLETKQKELIDQHECTLQELRARGDAEIEKLRTQMRQQEEAQKDRERELQQTISESNSFEKAELLEKVSKAKTMLQTERSGAVMVKTKLQNLEKDLKQAHAAELKVKTDEIERLQTEMSQSQALKEKLENLKRKFEQDNAVNTQFIVELRTQHSEEMKAANKPHVEKIEALEKRLRECRDEMIELRAQHAEEKEIGNAPHLEKIAKLEQELTERQDTMQKALEKAAAELKECQDSNLKESNKKGAALRAKHEKLNLELRKQHTDEIKSLSKIHEDKVAELETEIKLLSKSHKEQVVELETKVRECQADALQSSKKQLDELRKKHEQKIDTLAKEHSDAQKELAAKLQANEDKYKDLLLEANGQFETFNTKCAENTTALQQELREKKAALQKAEQQLVEAKQIREKYEELKIRQSVHAVEMTAAEDNHNKQFEDLLAQLDLVEAEHQGTLLAKEKTLSEKEAIVGALGSQLAEAERMIKEETEQSRQAKEKCRALEEEIHAFKTEMNSLKDSQKKFMKDAAVAQAKACEAAREEMIEKAEHQFQQANEHYVKLRKQYDESQERGKKFESELRSMKRKVDKLTQEKELLEIDLKAEVTKLNAMNAKIEAESAQKAKEYRRELERLLQTAKDFESQAEVAEKKVVTSTKKFEKLKREYDEMKSVSEELMAIVEGNNERHEC